MNKTVLLSTILTASVICLTGTANAQSVRLSNDRDSDAYRLAESLYGEELAGYRGRSLQTAVIDIDDDKAGELVVRVQSGASCSDGSCLTMMARYNSDERRWVELLRTHTTARSITLETSDSGFKHIIFDSDDAFVWNGEAYERDLSVAMEALDWQEASESEIAAIIRDDNYHYYNPEADQNATVWSAKGDINNDGSQEIFIQVDSFLSCGSGIGCPLWAFGGLEGQPFYKGMSHPSILLSNSLTNGFREIVISNQQGHVSQMWDGEKWVAGRTYYDN